MNLLEQFLLFTNGPAGRTVPELRGSLRAV